MVVRRTSIKHKITLSFLGIAAIRSILGFIVIAIIILPNIWSLEEQAIKTALLRTTNALEQKIESLGHFTDDWAYWDDTYRYLVGEAPNYEKSNLNDETLRVGKLGFMNFITPDGEIVWGRHFKPDNTALAYAGAPTHNYKWPERFITELQKHPMGMSGYFSSYLGEFFFTARPVLTNYRKGPSHGWIIIGRWLDDSFTTHFNRLMQQPVIFQIPQLENIETFKQQLNDDIKFYIKRLSITEIRSQALVNDYNNEPAFMVTIDEERSIFITLWKATLAAIVCFLLVGSLSTWLAFHRVQKIIIDPLSDLANKIEHADNKKLPLSRPKLESGDEISLIYHKFKDVTGRLFKAQQALEKRTMTLEVEASTDPLTQLYNRRYLDRLMMMVSENILADPNQKKLLLLIDIDHFKKLNDKFGHATGDQVLVQLADILKSVVRKQDHIIRMGGEEFLLITDGQGIESAQELAERVRERVEKSCFTSDLSESLNITVSIGFTWYPLCHSAVSGEDWQTALKLADHALYQVKTLGRNDWCGYATEASFNKVQLAMISEDMPQLLASNKLQQLISKK